MVEAMINLVLADHLLRTMTKKEVGRLADLIGPRTPGKRDAV